MGRILIVDDEESICWALRQLFEEEGHEAQIASSSEEALARDDLRAMDAILLDVRLPGQDGLSLLRRLRQRKVAAPIVVMTAFGNLETAVRAIEEGAFDYLPKPFDLDRASAVVGRAIEEGKLGGRAADPEAASDELLVGKSPAMQDLFKRIALAARSEVPILITGESGTGKELVARAIHRHSARSGGPFLPVHLAALSPGLVEAELFGHVRGSFTGAIQDRKGLFELANGGTVLLDEIGDVPPPIQVKLLRAIEHREITLVGDARPRPTNLRLLAATNRPLDDLIAAGAFREDLYFRLSVFPIHVPPLRDRPGDVLLLAEHFLRKTGAAEARFTEAARAELQSRPWVGNVRELKNAVEHAAIMARSRSIAPEHLPAPLAPAADAARAADDLEERIADWARREAERDASDRTLPAIYERFLEVAEPPLLRAVLERTRGNRADAAQRLGIHRATLRQKLRRYRIEG